MMPNFKKTQIDSYINKIENNIFEKQCQKFNSKKDIKVSDNVIIPKYSNIDILFEYNYTIDQLKGFLSLYKLKKVGSKSQLLRRLYMYIYLSKYVIDIQKVARGYIQKKSNNLHGPAWIKRDICNNTTDFLTFEELKDIPSNQFFSFKDSDGFIYGFDLVSIYNLIFTLKNGVYILNTNIKNPYNRKNITTDVINNVKKIMSVDKIIKSSSKINIQIKNISNDITIEKSLELRILDLFQYINSLGNYSDLNWFMNLNRNSLIRLVSELVEIWNYRAQLTPEIKRSICPPNGNPFRNYNIQYLRYEQNIINVRKMVLTVLEEFVYRGVNIDNKTIGSYYVLGSLTLVSEEAASSLPWLYASLQH